MPVAAIALVIAMMALSLTGQSIVDRRMRLASLDRRIVEAHRDIATLKVELNTRARLDEVARWTGALGLVQPDSTRYLPTLDALAGRGRQNPIILASATP